MTIYLPIAELSVNIFIILGMGVIVAFIVVAMLLAIFSINEMPL